MASPAGLDALRSAVSGGTVIDLRSEGERTGEQGLDTIWPGWWRDEPRSQPSARTRCYLPMPLLGRRVFARGVWAAADASTRVRWVGRRLRGEAHLRASVRAELAAGGLAHLYLWTLLGAERQIGCALRRIGANAGPTYICCVAGKDRTGLVVACALLCAGVPRAEVLADFAASASAAAALRHDPIVMRGLDAEGFDPDVFLQADPAALDRALDLAFVARGGVDAWWERAGMNKQEQARLQRWLRG